MAGGWNDGASIGAFMHAADLGGVLTTSNGVAVVSGAAATYGSWTQIIASTPSDIAALFVCAPLPSSSGAGLNWCIDLAAAPSGSEATGLICSALMIPPSSMGQIGIMLPVNIRAGSRLAARAASGSATQTLPVQLLGFDSTYVGGPAHSGVYDTICGWSGTGTITGTSIDPGATANTKGAYTQLIASTAHDYAGFVLSFDCKNAVGGASSVVAPQLLDIALGASGSEKIILPNMLVTSFPQNYTWSIGPSATAFIPIPIAAGTRVSARSQSSNNVAGDRTFGLSMYGLRA